jgi:hypothetical protein
VVPRAERERHFMIGRERATGFPVDAGQYSLSSVVVPNQQVGRAGC